MKNGTLDIKPNADPDKKLDLVIFGATSFIGQILTRCMAEHCEKHDKTLKWGIAGRSENKLNEIKNKLGSKYSSLPVILADAQNPTQLQSLCAQTGAVVSTVGPYAQYGEPLIKACVESGTDYCDLSGEVQWIKRMIDQYEDQAQASGARIVHCCGFDSIPSDMGVYYLQQQAQQTFGKPATQVKMRVKSAKGGVSGGTVASLMHAVGEAAADPEIRKVMTNPYSLCAGQRVNTAQHPVRSAQYDNDFKSWISPFIMATVNEPVVHRSNYLQQNAYGYNFSYNEAMLTEDGIKGRLKALAVTAATAGFVAGAATKPVRKALQKFVLPKSGEGPSQEKQENGYFNLHFFGQTDTGEAVKIKVTGDQDPGYGATGKMLCQAAISLCHDHAKDANKSNNANKPDQNGGFWTPASLFDDRFIQRLTKYAGLKFELLEKVA